VFVVAGFVLAQAMRHLLLWQRFAWPARTVSTIVIAVGTVRMPSSPRADTTGRPGPGCARLEGAP